MKISALNKERQVKEYDVILTYYNEKYNKKYIIYTEHKYNENHELVLYISEYDKKKSEHLVTDMIDIEEYNEIKKEIDKILITLKDESEKL